VDFVYTVVMRDNWLIKNGFQTIPCTTFPFAFRAMYNLVRVGVQGKKSYLDLTKSLFVDGPPSPDGTRTRYTYEDASRLATQQGLLTSDGQLRGKEFKSRTQNDRSIQNGK
jgi:hypothetical protein